MSSGFSAFVLGDGREALKPAVKPPVTPAQIFKNKTGMAPPVHVIPGGGAISITSRPNVTSLPMNVIDPGFPGYKAAAARSYAVVGGAAAPPGTAATRAISYSPWPRRSSGWRRKVPSEDET